MVVLSGDCVVLPCVDAWLEVLGKAVDSKVVLVPSVVVPLGETEVFLVDTAVSLPDILSLVGCIVTVRLANVVFKSAFGAGVVSAKESARRQNTNMATLVSRTWCIVCSEIRNRKNAKVVDFTHHKSSMTIKLS